MVGNKGAFWQALVFTLVVFGIGMIFGYFLENSRADKIEFALIGSEINLLDEQLRSGIIGSGNLSCDVAVASTFSFADKIYSDALMLEKYADAGKFSNDVLMALHRKYDLLRMILWDESIRLRNRCGGFNTIVYFFHYNIGDINLKARQVLYSRILMDIKNKHSNKVLLIPIASNMDLASVELAMEKYRVEETPSIFVNENKVISEVITFEEFEKIVFPNGTGAKEKLFG